MKLIKFIPAVLSLATSTLAQSFCSSASHSGQGVKTSGNKTGSIGSVGYEMWADSGINSATFYSDGSFSCSFSRAKDYLCRSGLSFDSTKTHSQIGHLYADFKLVKKSITNVDYSYVGIYGWTRNPLVEFYIVDNWLSQYRPGDWVGNKKHGDFTIDGAQYTVYENTRTGPSIDGNTTFKQYFSIRKQARDCGTIDISAHFAQWEKLGMKMGKMYEAKILGEAGSNGAGTSGTADFPYAKVYIGQGNGGNGRATSAPPQQVPPQQVPPQQVPPQQAPYQQAPPQQAPYQQVPNQQAPNQQAKPQQAPNQQAPNQQAPNQQAPNQQAPNQQAKPQQAPYQQAPPQNQGGNQRNQNNNQLNQGGNQWRWY